MSPASNKNSRLCGEPQRSKLWWFTLLLAALFVLPACMRDDEEESVSVWAISSQMSASRRYPIRGPKGERAFVLKRRGPTLILTDNQSRPIAKASVRRDQKHVVVRDGGGEIVATAKLQGALLEIVDSAGKSLATLGPFEGETAKELKRGEVVAFTFSEGEPMRIEGPTLSSPRLVNHTPTKIEKLMIFSEGNEEESLLSIDARSGLSSLAFGVLTLEDLAPTTRLGLAAYLNEFGTSSGK